MRERIHAPDFSSVRTWLNSGRPLSLRQLRGQVVVLDFWTYCCINCMHVFPILRDLEERHRADPLVVIGVHSAKFDAEKDAARIRAAMERYGVSHPVAVDEDMEVWSRYAIRSWPTLVVLRPDGTLAAVAPGEPDPDLLESFVSAQLEEGRREGTLANAPLRFEAGAASARGPLLYPGKAIAAADGRIFVSDSGHHRVLVLDRGGRVRDCIGSGARGQREGPFERSALDDPQGLAHDAEREALYLADARAHVIYRADLRGRTLTRIAGTGELGRLPLAKGHATSAPSTSLRSPWDLALDGRRLYIALAGSHQLACLRLDEGTIELLSGSGREALVDGPAGEAALAQPSGLSLGGGALFVADSESSGVRKVDPASGWVATLAGGPGLFDFGDGVGEVRPGLLQHPLAVLSTPDGVLVADTYNDKLKRFSPDGARLDSFFETAGGFSLAQPAGLALLEGGEVLVADTNHHRLLRISRDGRKASAVEISAAPARAKEVRPTPPAPRAGVSSAGWFTALLEARSGAGLGRGDGRLVFEVRAPEGFELAAGAPYAARLEVSRRSDLLRLAQEDLRGESAGGTSLRLEVRTDGTHDEDVESEVLLSLHTVACDAKDHAACHPLQNHFRLPLRLLREGEEEVRFLLPLSVGGAASR